jgi:hypothetical protein
MRRRLLYVAGFIAVALAVQWFLPNNVFYQRRRPTKTGRAVNGLWARVYGIGILPSFLSTLETTGSRSGRLHAIPVVIADYNGGQYIVSMLGPRSPWVRNIQAAEGRAFLRRGRRRTVHLAEVPVEERAPIIKAYIGRAIGARPHIPLRPDAPLEEFERIAADYPVFRIGPEREPAVATVR